MPFINKPLLGCTYLFWYARGHNGLTVMMANTLWLTSPVRTHALYKHELQAAAPGATVHARIPGTRAVADEQRDCERNELGR